MVLQKSIPTCIRILGHVGLVYHPGQACTCFHCGTLGHESKRCPAKKPPSPKPGKKLLGAKETPKKSCGQPSTTPGPSPGQSSNPKGPSTSVPQARPIGPESPNYEEELPPLATSSPSPHGKIDSSAAPLDKPSSCTDNPVLADEWLKLAKVDLHSESSSPHPRGKTNSPVAPSDKSTPTNPVFQDWIQLALQQGTIKPEVFSSPKGTFIPPVSNNVIPSVGTCFTDPP